MCILFTLNKYFIQSFSISIKLQRWQWVSILPGQNFAHFFVQAIQFFSKIKTNNKYLFNK